MPPTIYGTGTGPFNRLTHQAPTIMRSALLTGEVMQVGADDSDVEYVQVEDLADLYTIVAHRIVKDGMQGFPSGERGIYFAGTGKYTWGEFSRGIAKAMYEVGAVKTDEVRKVGLKEAAGHWMGGNELFCELVFGSNVRTQAETSRSLGWKPKKTEQDFHEHYLETAKLFMESQA
ncbi:MAG: hypothetical protein Q9211_003322 [Gyalolechia sp. 1 TL-2023]